jgi:hypothetical protein
MDSLPEEKLIEEECPTETIHCNTSPGARFRIQKLQLKRRAKSLGAYNKQDKGRWEKNKVVVQVAD